MQSQQSEPVIEITIDEKGQMTIPAELRQRFGIAGGTRIRMVIANDPPRIVLVPITREYIHAFRGILKHTDEAEKLQRRRKDETFRGPFQRQRSKKGGLHGKHRSR